jgi:hypothetical protein
MPLSPHGEARRRADRGQQADGQNLEQPAVVIRIDPERQLNPRWPRNRHHDDYTCYASGGKFGYDQSPAHRVPLRIHGKLIDDVASDVPGIPGFAGRYHGQAIDEVKVSGPLAAA